MSDIIELDYEKFFTEMECADSVQVLTGAGISTLSGIPDFRGKNGLYSKKWQGYEPEELLGIDFFRRHPDIFYCYAAECLYPILDCAPSSGHTTLATLQKRGVIQHIYTQNIDSLHTKAGASGVVEFHGSLRTHSCVSCHESIATAAIRATAAAGTIPRCPVCCNLLKPDFVFYGDAMDSEQLETAFRNFEQTDILLVMGTSLTVAPVSSLPLATTQNNGTLVIVNEQPTPYDRYARYRFPDIADFCERLSKFAMR